MDRRVVLRPETEADLLQARDWYGKEGPELAEAFADSFEEIIASIEDACALYCCST